MQVSYGDGTWGCTTPSCRRTKQGTTVLQTDTWYRVVGIVRGPQDMDIYIDCRNDEGQYTGTGGDIAYSNQSGSIGRVDQSSLAPYYFDGSLDDFRYWNRELTVDEVLMLCSPALSIQSQEGTQTSELQIHVNDDGQGYLLGQYSYERIIDLSSIFCFWPSSNQWKFWLWEATELSMYRDYPRVSTFCK
jgi:hypothetical protein